MIFDRWCAPHGHTIAFRIAKRDVEEINQFQGNVQGMVNHAQRKIAMNPNEIWFTNLIDYGSTLKNKYKVKVSDARPQLDAAINWTRLASLVFTASALELYIRRVVALSIESNPGLLIGVPGIVDGAYRLKIGSNLDVSTSVKECTEGVWSKRHCALESLFGALPQTQSVLKDLNRLQTTRNAIAHDFARISVAKDFWYLDPGHVQQLSATSVTQNMLVTSIKGALVAMEEIESIAVGHIGAFETIRFWNSFVTANPKEKANISKRYTDMYKSGDHAKLVSSFNYEMGGGVLGREYSNDLLSYYRAL